MPPRDRRLRAREDGGVRLALLRVDRPAGLGLAVDGVGDREVVLAEVGRCLDQVDRLELVGGRRPSATSSVTSVRTKLPLTDRPGPPFVSERSSGSASSADRRDRVELGRRERSCRRRRRGSRPSATIDAVGPACVERRAAAADVSVDGSSDRPGRRPVADAPTPPRPPGPASSSGQRPVELRLEPRRSRPTSRSSVGLLLGVGHA